MKIKKIFLLFFSLLMSLFVKAQTITPVFDSTAKTISIIVNTDFECWGVGFKFYLPEGVTVPEYENEDEDMLPNIVKGSRAKSSSTLDIKTTPDGGYSLNLYGAAFKTDATKPVIVITLAGDLKGAIKFDAIAFTDQAATAYKQDSFDFTLVTPPTEVRSIKMVMDFKASDSYSELSKDIPAAGGKDRAVSLVTFSIVARTFMSDGTYTDSEKSEVQKALIYGDYTSDVPSLGTTVQERSKVGTSTPKGTILDSDNIPYKAETADTTKIVDFEAVASAFDIYQEANAITYQDVSISPVDDITFSSDGDSCDLSSKIVASQKLDYTSGASSDGNITLSYITKTSVEGYGLSGSKVTVTSNLNSTPRNGFVVTATANGQGGKSASVDITFNQPVSTAINSLSISNSDAKIYDVNGRVVNKSIKNLAKGIYIINNKKYIVK